MKPVTETTKRGPKGKFKCDHCGQNIHDKDCPLAKEPTI